MWQGDLQLASLAARCSLNPDVLVASPRAFSITTGGIFHYSGLKPGPTPVLVHHLNCSRIVIEGIVIGTAWLLFAASSEVSLLLEKRHAAA
jgi:hypothetical protein